MTKKELSEKLESAYVKAITIKDLLKIVEGYAEKMPTKEADDNAKNLWLLCDIALEYAGTLSDILEDINDEI